MTFNDNGELIVDGEIIPNSNVVDIINNAFRKKSKASEAYDKFLEVLSESAVPHEVLRDIVRPDPDRTVDYTPQRRSTTPRQKSKRKNIRFETMFPTESTPKSSYIRLNTSSSESVKPKRRQSTPRPKQSDFASWRNLKFDPIYEDDQ
jgi:hypothetical protein